MQSQYPSPVIQKNLYRIPSTKVADEKYKTGMFGTNKVFQNKTGNMNLWNEVQWKCFSGLKAHFNIKTVIRVRQRRNSKSGNGLLRFVVSNNYSLVRNCRGISCQERILPEYCTTYFPLLQKRLRLLVPLCAVFIPMQSCDCSFIEGIR